MERFFHYVHLCPILAELSNPLKKYHFLPDKLIFVRCLGNQLILLAISHTKRLKSEYALEYEKKKMTCGVLFAPNYFKISLILQCCYFIPNSKKNLVNTIRPNLTKIF